MRSRLVVNFRSDSESVENFLAPSLTELAARAPTAQPLLSPGHSPWENHPQNIWPEGPTLDSLFAYASQTANPSGVTEISPVRTPLLGYITFVKRLGRDHSTFCILQSAFKASATLGKLISKNYFPLPHPIHPMGRGIRTDKGRGVLL